MLARQSQIPLSNLATPQQASSQDASERPAFERGLAIARRNLILLVICFVTVPVIALAYSLTQTPQYTASASLLFGASEAGQTLFNSPVLTETDPQRAAATNLRLVSLEQIASRTAKALDKPGLTTTEVRSKVAIVPQGESDLISVEATDASPAFATRLANEFSRQYISFRSETDKAKITRAEALVQEKFAELTPAQQAGQEGQNLVQRERQLTVLGTLQTGNAELVQAATIPSSPSSPTTKRNVALGILLGIVLGICLALLREQLDRRIKDLDDVEELFDLPILGTIPQSGAILHSGPGAELEPTGMEGEAFRMLRANLRYFNVDREITSILVTSAAPQDGKTTVAWNVALAEARAGKRVLYLEADLRRPSLSAHLGLDAENGLSMVLVGSSEPMAAIQEVQGVDLILAGPIPPNPAELIESQRMSDLLTWGERTYDRVIIDTPPAAVVADAVALFKEVDGVVVVARLRRSPRDAAEHLRDQLANTGAPVLGLVVNGVGAPSDNDYYRTPAATGPFADETGRRWGRKQAKTSNPAAPVAERQAAPAGKGRHTL